MLEETGFVEARVGPPCDTFGDAKGEQKARASSQVYGYPFLAAK